jgi:hypothetical protein
MLLVNCCHGGSRALHDSQRTSLGGRPPDNSLAARRVYHIERLAWQEISRFPGVSWRTLARRTTKIAAVALANKTARMIWAIMTTGAI